MKFVRSTQENETNKVTVYIPLHNCNILSFNYVQVKETTDTETVIKESYFALEMTTVAEQVFPVPLKAFKRVKQTKTEEYFVTETTERVMRPVIHQIKEESAVSYLYRFLESNLV